MHPADLLAMQAARDAEQAMAAQAQAAAAQGTAAQTAATSDDARKAADEYAAVILRVVAARRGA